MEECFLNTQTDDKCDFSFFAYLKAHSFPYQTQVLYFHGISHAKDNSSECWAERTEATSSARPAENQDEALCLSGLAPGWEHAVSVPFTSTGVWTHTTVHVYHPRPPPQEMPCGLINTELLFNKLKHSTFLW